MDLHKLQLPEYFQCSRCKNKYWFTRGQASADCPRCKTLMDPSTMEEFLQMDPSNQLSTAYVTVNGDLDE